ncbi:GMP synthase-Glutamine amidotransferase [Palleronia salina]|uniref:GMP synthase-Glutamine amidotransferase n=2 Tax=Palleronia TaxID=315422 RepID=A0A1M6G2T5_9RHOB|nr:MULTISPECIES: type 1 glutamine amidotransferase [Palleronia]SEN46188.1 GMP synthase-Glutamine amidotransferase [Palleronia pelagia]SHJ04204.1 GMP synthase-Glutamine amidotransferase [Palleronia salina]
MHLGLLQCGPTAPALDDRHGGYPELYAALIGPGFDWTTWRVFDGDFPDGPDAAEGWLVSGSKFGAYEDHDWIAPLERLIRGIHDSGRPLVGICFGHQVVAQALGGRVEKFAGGWAVGRQTYTLEGDTVHLNAWHQDQVTQLPPGAEVIATNDFARTAGLRIGPATLTLQPHPEFGRDYVADLIDARGRGVVPEPLLDGARDGLGQPVDNARIGAWLADFYRAHKDPR